MNSPFANLFLAIRSRIIDSIPSIVHIDQDRGQLQNSTALKGRFPVNFPCVLIDFEDFNFSDLGERVQSAKGTIVLRLGYATYSNTGQTTPDEYVEQALAYYDLEFKLHESMQGWSAGENFGNLDRISVTTQKRNDNVRVREIRYTVAFDDYSMQQKQRWIPVRSIIEEVKP